MIKGYKTLAMAIILGLITALSSAEMQQYVATNLTWLGPILGTGIVMLRALTTTPIFKKD